MASIVLVHTPVHASWLNQIEVTLGRSAQLLTPNDFESLVDLKRNVMAFQIATNGPPNHSSGLHAPDLHALLAKLKKRRAKPEDRGAQTSP